MQNSVFAESFNKSIRNLLQKQVFEQSDDDWIDVLPVLTKHFNNRIHSSTQLTPIQAGVKKNEGYVYQKILDKRKRTKPKFHVNDLVRTADSKKTFSKGDTTNWFYSLYKKVENNTIQHRVIVLTICQSVITKHWWKRQS